MPQANNQPTTSTLPNSASYRRQRKNALYQQYQTELDAEHDRFLIERSRGKDWVEWQEVEDRHEAARLRIKKRFMVNLQSLRNENRLENQETKQRDNGKERYYRQNIEMSPSRSDSETVSDEEHMRAGAGMRRLPRQGERSRPSCRPPLRSRRNPHESSLAHLMALHSNHRGIRATAYVILMRTVER